MSTKKFITYKVLDSNGLMLKDKYELKLNINEEFGNYLIHKDISRHKIQGKQNTVSTKTRSEVRGGGRKPWRQKGTGRARAGSNRSPLWKGGGIIFGPKPKITKIKLNKKERQLAFQTLLYNKRNFITVIDNLENTIDIPKTKKFCSLCENCNISLDQKLLVVVSKKIANLALSIRNIKNVDLVSAKTINSYNLIKAKKILITTQAINEIKEIYCD